MCHPQFSSTKNQRSAKSIINPPPSFFAFEMLILKIAGWHIRLDGRNILMNEGEYCILRLILAYIVISDLATPKDIFFFCFLPIPIAVPTIIC